MDTLDEESLYPCDLSHHSYNIFLALFPQLFLLGSLLWLHFLDLFLVPEGFHSP
jgi:hypothetical protein